MTLEQLLQELLLLTPEERQSKVELFDYDKDQFVPLPALSVCREGEPYFHLTIN